MNNNWSAFKDAFVPIPRRTPKGETPRKNIYLFKQGDGPLERQNETHTWSVVRSGDNIKIVPGKKTQDDGVVGYFLTECPHKEGTMEYEYV